MKANKIVAKNLLQGKTCDNCMFRMSKMCGVVEQKKLPKENTCEQHASRCPPYKFNVKWTASSLKALKSAFHGVDAEKELIKTATNEIKREFKKKKWNTTRKRNDYC